MEDHEINDIRNAVDFRGFSFSNYKRTEVKTQLLEYLKLRKVEQSCYWTAELICSGHFNDIWEIVFHFMSKYIHLANPKLILYLENRYNIFANIVNQRHYINELDLRNNGKIRLLFAEMITILAISVKKTSFELLKINFAEDFNLETMHEKFKAPSVEYAKAVFRPKDPQEFFIALNEFAFHLSKDSKNIAECSYWLEWIIEFDTHCKKKKSKCVADKRNEYDVDTAFKGEIIWIIWDILTLYSSYSPLIEKLVGGLCNIFCINFTAAATKRRKHILYYAISIITENINENLPDMISNKQIVENVLSKVNNIYKQIKANEISPNTEYLFDNMEKDNTLNESIRKLDIMNSAAAMTAATGGGGGDNP